MTTTAPQDSAATALPRPQLGGSFIDALAAQDFGRLGDALGADVQARALLPGGLREWTGAEVVARQFARWFGNTEDFELVGSAVDAIGGRLHLGWRLRLRAERLGPGWFTVEQQAYADTDGGGPIARLDLLCTGYLAEAVDD